jgi:hypothetical protein
VRNPKRHHVDIVAETPAERQRRFGRFDQPIEAFVHDLYLDSCHVTLEVHQDVQYEGTFESRFAESMKDKTVTHQ